MTADPLLSRRTLIVGAGALGALATIGLGACSDDEAEADSPDEAVESDRAMVVMTDAPATLVVDEPGRIPLGLADSTGALLTSSPPALTVRVTDADGASVGEPIEVPRRDSGLERAYYPLSFTPPAAGFYRALAEVDGEPVDAAFEVSDPTTIVIPRPGQPMPATPTPTTIDASGVDPICTNDPRCALHETDLDEVLGTSSVAVLVSTPAFCSTAICGPVLDLFVAAADANPDVTFVHVEPYASGDRVREEGPSADNLSPAVNTWELSFEPCLFLVDADGTIVERLDVIYDADELAAAVARIA